MVSTGRTRSNCSCCGRDWPAARWMCRLAWTGVSSRWAGLSEGSPDSSALGAITRASGSGGVAAPASASVAAAASLLALVAAVILLFSPAAAVGTIAVLAGLGFLLRGGSEIGLALSLRRST